MRLYNTNYGKNQDTLRPQLQMQGNKLFGTRYNPQHATARSSVALPWYEVKGNKIFTTQHNPQGHDLHPWYEIRGDKVYQTINHPDGISHMPAFRMK